MEKELTFESERLFINPVNTEDSNFILNLLNTPKWLHYIGDRNVKTLEDAKKYIETRMLPQIEKLGYGNYILSEKETRKKIGACGLYHRDGIEVVDLGFAFLPKYEGKGYGYEAASVIKNAGFNIFNLKKISAITSQQNSASQKLLTKLGFSYIKNIILPNETEELFYYELIE